MDLCSARPLLARTVSALLFVAALGGVATGGGTAGGTPGPSAESQLIARVQAALPAATGRGTPRFTRIALDSSGDLTVIFKVESAATISGLRKAAMTDEVTLLCAIYRFPAANQVRTATVIGTYAISQGDRTRELPVVRATLTAKRAMHIDWATARPDQLPRLVDDWWLHPALSEAAATSAASPAGSPIGGTP